MKIGYALSSEEHAPATLIREAKLAEEAGFHGLWISDHYHPWNDEQGESPFVWGVLGAIAGAIAGLFQRTVRILPSLARSRFLDAWAGLRPMCPDHQPLIGADLEIDGLYWATGHFTMGILSAPATAKAIADLIDSGRTAFPISGFSAQRFLAPASTQ